MHPLIRNVLAVILGAVIGAAVNMGLYHRRSQHNSCACWCGRHQYGKHQCVNTSVCAQTFCISFPGSCSWHLGWGDGGFAGGCITPTNVCLPHWLSLSGGRHCQCLHNSCPGLVSGTGSVWGLPANGLAGRMAAKQVPES